MFLKSRRAHRRWWFKATALGQEGLEALEAWFSSLQDKLVVFRSMPGRLEALEGTLRDKMESEIMDPDLEPLVHLFHHPLKVEPPASSASSLSND